MHFENFSTSLIKSSLIWDVYEENNFNVFNFAVKTFPMFKSVEIIWSIATVTVVSSSKLVNTHIYSVLLIWTDVSMCTCV